jgi:hypothetical protein
LTLSSWPNFEIERSLVVGTASGAHFLLILGTQRVEEGTEILQLPELPEGPSWLSMQRLQTSVLLFSSSEILHQL